MSLRLIRNRYRNILLPILGFMLVTVCSCKNATEKTQDEAVLKEDIWAQADAIIQEIGKPNFADTTFNILDYGAQEGGTVLNADAIADAIEACNAAGGGRVLIPAGRFLTGPIHLKSNVNLHLEEGAEVLFTTDKSAYLPVVHTSYEGMEIMNYSPLIYAKGQKNIAVTGKGTFNGQADKELVALVWSRALRPQRGCTKTKR